MKEHEKVLLDWMKDAGGHNAPHNIPGCTQLTAHLEGISIGARDWWMPGLIRVLRQYHSYWLAEEKSEIEKLKNVVRDMASIGNMYLPAFFMDLLNYLERHVVESHVDK